MDGGHNQEGFSLLELFLVVGIGAIFLLAGLATYRLVYTDATVNDTLEVVYGVQSQVKKIYANVNGYPDASMIPTLVSTTVFPDSVHIDPGGPTVFHPFGGEMDIVGHENFFTIELYDMRPGECLKVTQSFDVKVVGDDYRYVEVESITFDDITGVTMADLAAACDSAEIVDVVFAFN